MKNSIKKKTIPKALVVSDERQNSWFLNEGFHEANDLKRRDRFAAPKGRRLAAAAPELKNPSGSLALMTPGPLVEPTIPRG
jgi:hypothetical protein